MRDFFGKEENIAKADKRINVLLSAVKEGTDIALEKVGEFEDIDIATAPLEDNLQLTKQIDYAIKHIVNEIFVCTIKIEFDNFVWRGKDEETSERMAYINAMFEDIMAISSHLYLRQLKESLCLNQIN